VAAIIAAAASTAFPSFLKNHRPRGRGERFSGHGHPMRSVQRRLLRALGEGRRGDDQTEHDLWKHAAHSNSNASDNA
jgi:hypothetical protein